MHPAILVALAFLAAPANAAPVVATQSETFSTARGSTYAIAKATCARQGKKIQMFSDQTNDRYTAVSVRISYRCVAAPRATPKAGAKRAAKRR